MRRSPRGKRPGRGVRSIARVLALLLAFVAPGVSAQAPSADSTARAYACRRDPACMTTAAPLYAAFYAEALRGRVRRMRIVGGLAALGGGTALAVALASDGSRRRALGLTFGVPLLSVGAVVLGTSRIPGRRARRIELYLRASGASVLVGASGRL